MVLCKRTPYILCIKAGRSCCMVIDIIYNIALLLSLSVLFTTFEIKDLAKNRRYEILLGLFIGVVGLLVMSRPFVLFEGIVFDSRSILIGATGMFFGIVPACISSFMMAVYRVIQGGGGLYTGVSVIASSCAIGIWWHQKRLTAALVRAKPPHLEFYLVGLFIHVVMLLCMFLMPAARLGEVLRAMTIPILGVYPLGSYLLAILLYNQMSYQMTVKRLAVSEYRFKKIFEQAPVGITLTDSTGKIIDANQKFLEIMEMKKEALLSLDWMTITHPDDFEEDVRQMNRMLSGEIDAYEMDKRYIRPDGSFVWVHMAVTMIISDTSGTRNHLCMVTDITARKEAQEAITYATMHDYLTGVYNRTHCEQHMREIDQVCNLPLTVVMGDVNGLKLINDAFGHQTGDEVLRLVAQTIVESLGSDGYCARFGGDEFVLVLPNTEKTTADELVRTIQQKIASQLLWNMELSLSFGSATKYEAQSDINQLIVQAENDMNKNKLFESPSMRSKAIYTIINALHEKNKREELHSQRVSVLSAQLGAELGLDAKEVAELRTAGLLHDIGKIAIHDAILNKEGRLDEKEWEEMKRHSEIGYRILGTVSDMGQLAEYVLAHHERFDGQGYPKGLLGQQIPLQSRIIAIADSYDAMTAQRTYRKQVTDEEAAAEIKNCAGKQFDPHLARLFVERILNIPWDQLQPPSRSSESFGSIR